MRVGMIVAIALLASSCGGRGESDPNLRTVKMKVQFLDARTQDPLPRLEVCAAEREDVACSTTDEDGRAEVTLPAESNVMLSCIIHSHVAMYMTLTTGTADFDVGVFRILDRLTGTLFVASGFGRVRPGDGIALINVYEDLINRETRVADITATMSPGVGDGPVYGGDNGLPTRTLKASGTGGPIAFYEVPEGEYTLEITHPSRTCTGGFGWPSDGPLKLRTKVFAGGISTVTFVCPP